MDIETKNKQRIQAITDLLKRDTISLEDLCTATGLKPFSLELFARKHNIEIPYERLPPGGFRPEIDLLIPFLGLRQTEIAERVGDVKRSFVGNYLKISGQHGMWKEARKRKQGGNRELQRWQKQSAPPIDRKKYYHYQPKMPLRNEQ